MSAEASTYIARHVWLPQTATRNVLWALGELADQSGRVRASQAMIGESANIWRQQVSVHMSRLYREKIVARTGRTYLILGVLEHDLRVCDHPLCIEQAKGLFGRRRRRPTLVEVQQAV